MSTYKNTIGDLTLTGNGGMATLAINYANTIFNGNVVYTVPSITTSGFLTVAANNTGAITDGGVLMQTGPGTFSGLRFDTIANVWQVSSSVTSLGVPVEAYSNIATAASSAVPGGNPGAVQFNGGGTFSGDDKFLFDSANSYLYTNAAQYIGYQATPPIYANSVVLYSNTAGGGGTGLYFNSAAAADELVSKSKAIVYGIIF